MEIATTIGVVSGIISVLFLGENYRSKIKKLKYMFNENSVYIYSPIPNLEGYKTFFGEAKDIIWEFKSLLPLVRGLAVRDILRWKEMEAYEELINKALVQISLYSEPGNADDLSQYGLKKVPEYRALIELCKIHRELYELSGDKKDMIASFDHREVELTEKLNKASEHVQQLNNITQEAIANPGKTIDITHPYLMNTIVSGWTGGDPEDRIRLDGNLTPEEIALIEETAK